MSEPKEGSVYDVAKAQWVEAPPAPVIVDDVTPKKEEEKPTPEPEPPAKVETTTPEAAAAKVAAEVKKETPTDVKSDEIPAWMKTKYGIETQEELDEVLNSSNKLADELEKERNKKVFSSEKEEKLHKFLSDWDLDKIGEGMQTAATLLNMDLKNIDQRKALEEAYILDNTDLTRDEAKALFNKEYRKKYEIKKDSFDTDEEYEEEKKISEIQLKKDFNKAIRFLEEKKDSLKVKETKAEAKAETPIETIRDYSTKIDKFFSNFEKFTEKDDDGTELYNINLNADQREQIRTAMKEYVKRTDVYDKTGKIPNFDPLDLSQSFAEILFGKWMRDQRNKQIKVIAQATKAEQIAGRKPDKVSKAEGKASGLSLDEQFVERAKAERAKRETAR